MPYAFVLIGSCLAGLLLAIFPLSPALSGYRPAFLCLLMIYWVLYTPERVGVGIAWLMGLAQDVVADAVWGGHAFALALVAYITLMSYRRLLSYSLGQQTFWVFVLVGIHQLFVNWAQSLDGYGNASRYMLGSALLTTLFWPLLLPLMLRLQRYYRLY